MSKRSKLNDDTSQVMFQYNGYIGNDHEEEVPNNVTHVRCLPSVVSINHEAFYHCKSLREVVLNEGLKEIENHAFTRCTSLQSITLPSTVTMIGSNAFASCESLIEVELIDGLREIGEYAFDGCNSLQSITLPSTIEINRGAFNSCRGLSEVVLNEGVQDIKYATFNNCISLERITIPSTVTEIDQYAISYCPNLRDVVCMMGLRGLCQMHFTVVHH